MGGSLFGWTLVALAALLISTTSALSQDGVVLLEIKDGFDENVGLESWRAEDENPCNWTGITCHLPQLSVRSIDLPYMKLEGTISGSIGKLQKLWRLALHSNNLHGSIPAEIGNCSELRALYLRNNHLGGSIPPELGRLKQLTILDLSGNSLKGSIPSAIAHIKPLRFLNLSSNFLSGEVPYFGALATFKNTSFLGNSDLCGHPTDNTCRGSLGFPAVLPHSEDPSIPDEPKGIPDSPKPSTSHYLNMILIVVMSMMGMGVIIMLLFLWICLLSKGRLGEKYVKVNKQHVQDNGMKFLSFRGDLPYLSFDIIKRLELLNEEDVVGSGAYGTVYKMFMDDGSVFAVKRIDRSCELSDKVFEKELEMLGSVKHMNIVNMRGYCRLPSAKFIIYDYFSLGSLHDYLHEHEQEDQPLNWNARLRIAFGSARGLAYLHHDCYPPIVHGNVKSSNILLDRSMEAHISDFGLSKCLVYDDRHTTTVVAGTFGYLAPEYLNSGKATEWSDVYSFGILLLELLTGKKPTDMIFLEKGLNIVGWMNLMTRDNLLHEIVDERCGFVDADSVEVILDIASMCCHSDPNKRPSMNGVLQMLEEAIFPSAADFHECQLDVISSAHL